MRLKYIYTIALLFWLVSSNGNAQNIRNSKIKWTLTQSSRILETLKPYRGELITEGVNKIIWLQKNGEKQSDYEITNTIGEWANIQQNGKIEYLVQKNGRKGKLLIERTIAGVSIVFYFDEAFSDSNALKFIVGEIDTIQ